MGKFILKILLSLEQTLQSLQKHPFYLLKYLSVVIPWISKVAPVVAHISWSNYICVFAKRHCGALCSIGICKGVGFLIHSLMNWGLTQDMPGVILCTWRGFLSKHFPPDHLQRNI